MLGWRLLMILLNHRTQFYSMQSKIVPFIA
jgi:hypothetical protein